MKKFYFTFGAGQPHEGGYHVIEAQTADEARRLMNQRFEKWAMQYDSAEAAGVERFGLREVQ